MASRAPRPAPGRARSCPASTFRSGCGRCRRRPSLAASSSGSTSPGDLFPSCRSCCWTSRPPRSTLPIAQWWSNWSNRKNARALRWWRSFMMMKFARRSPTGSSTSPRLLPRPEERCDKMSATTETIIGNARLVLADRVIEHGWVAFADGRIAEFGEGKAPSGSGDAGGDLVMPGLIELHTDHLEAHYEPRPKVYWNPIAAVVSYDGQLATSGITTVLDSLRVWREDGAEDVDGRAGILAEAITAARDANLLRADHFLHLRCEIPMPDVVEEAKELVGRPDVRLMSLMDHTPGQRQFRDEAKLRDYYRGKGAGMTDAELDVLFERRFTFQKKYATNNLREIVALAHSHEIPLASHDDTTDENVTDAIRHRVSVAEFPTTMEAARGLHGAGIDILMGAPNVVRGGSHSGNIAAVDLAHEGLLDILSSDYVPSSLLMGALQLPQRVPAIDLAAAVRTVTKTPADAVGLSDRGEIAAGKRADLIRVHVVGDVPVVRSAWRQGRRVA